ncbi:hypothetical protein HU200_056302 [Digitaria exilis]|uniref:Plastocyanin-like domain-containing protein n=1 Tax=Digitaria exilis TaxID=1010633 RepID=A0A835E3Q1_9POAL|nr:hypothetical protein HU200_056302 [Digitaria exilis]
MPDAKNLPCHDQFPPRPTHSLHATDRTAAAAELRLPPSSGRFGDCRHNPTTCSLMNIYTTESHSTLTAGGSPPRVVNVHVSKVISQNPTRKNSITPTELSVYAPCAAMAHNRRLRSDAAPFRPSAAAATHHHPYAAATRHHEWEIGYHQLNFPDCVPKLAVTINGQTAGPTILAVQGDTIVVRVKNSLLTENVGIHWHGIRQMGTEGAPIPPGDFFTCNFVVDRPGTYTYQAHYYSMQGSAVLTGHIVVQEPFRYDCEHSVLINDLWHKSTCEPLVCVGEPRSLLINGRGRFVHCSNMAAAGTSNATNPECATPVFAGVSAQNNLSSTNIMPEDTVQSVWRDNCAEVFQDVVNKLRQPRRRLYAALDLEFVAEASTDVDFRDGNGSARTWPWPWPLWPQF